MNQKSFVSIFCGILLVVASTLPMTGCASNGQITSSASTNIQNALLTAANVLQQLNTGVQDVAPTVATILTMTHNQGDAKAVNDVIAESSAAQAALTTLLANVSTAIKAASTPTAQIAAVNAAVSPQAVAQIVAPIAAVGTTAPLATP